MSPSLPSPAARRLEDSRKGWFFGLLVYDGSRTVKALGGQGAGHTGPASQARNIQLRPASLAAQRGQSRSRNLETCKPRTWKPAGFQVSSFEGGLRLRLSESKPGNLETLLGPHPSLPPRPEASRTPERVGFLVSWFTMARGPSKSWEAREPAIPINQKTRKPTQFRECSHPPSLPPPAARSLEDSRKGWFFCLLVYDGSRSVKVLGGQGASHTNKPKKNKTNPLGRIPSLTHTLA